MSAGFSSILCALDTAHAGSRVLRHAVGMAGAFGARLTVMSVAHRAVGAVEAALGDALADAVPAGAPYPAECRVRVVSPATGTVAEALLAAAADGVDLLVVGTHATSGLSRWLLGSTSAVLMAETPCPTLLVPPGQVEIVQLAPDRAVLRPGAVLVAVDLEEPNARQLTIASQCAARAGQPLVALTVVPDGADTAAADDALRARVAGLAPVPVSRCLVRQGGVAGQIDEAALDEHAGLVVMGLRRQAGRGAVASAVLDARDAIVLAVPPAASFES